MIFAISPKVLDAIAPLHARKKLVFSFLTIAKQKKPRAAQNLKAAVRKQLSYLQRNLLSRIDAYQLLQAFLPSAGTGWTEASGCR